MCFHCGHFSRRERVGPTSRRRTWMILVDSCRRCNRIVRTAGVDHLTWEQYSWVRRWNAAQDSEN